MGNRRNLLLTGETFEFRIMAMLRSCYPDAIFLHDLHIYSQFLHKETQIDVVMISNSGVFVIEAKNWKHWIRGGYDDYEWSGLTNDRKVITVFNPVYQNLIHIRTLRNALRKDWDVPDFYNLVVLPDGTDIQSGCCEVMNLSMLPKRIREFKVCSVDVRKCEKAIRGVVC